MTRDAARVFREQALQILEQGFDSAQQQHPLDVQQAFCYDRPTLGGTVPIELYRAIRILAFREMLGSEIAAAVLKASGRSVGRKLEVASPAELVAALERFAIGRVVIDKQEDGFLKLTSSECATCSGLPAIGETFCHFEAGMIAGAMERIVEKPVNVVETRCWGLGDKVCSWEATVLDGGEAEFLEPLDLVMALAGKAASAIDSAYIIKESNRRLREAYRQLRESQRLAQDLTDMVVHDLRVPLATVIGSAQTLAELIGSGQDGAENELLQLTLSSSSTMMQMINDLLDISKLEGGRMALKKQRIHSADIVEEAAAQFAIVARRRRIKLHRDVADDLPPVLVDSEKLLRVLSNLLSNAIEHTSAGGQVQVSATRSPEGMLMVSVSDTGEGIPREFLKRVFDKFVQVESRRSKGRLSTGLGLTFCKLVVEAHGGKIWAESELGLGSTFYFTLP
jgi:signal transduction histidine kinase